MIFGVICKGASYARELKFYALQGNCITATEVYYGKLRVSGQSKKKPAADVLI